MWPLAQGAAALKPPTAEPSESLSHEAGRDEPASTASAKLSQQLLPSLVEHSTPSSSQQPAPPGSAVDTAPASSRQRQLAQFILAAATPASLPRVANAITASKVHTADLGDPAFTYLECDAATMLGGLALLCGRENAVPGRPTMTRRVRPSCWSAPPVRDDLIPSGTWAWLSRCSLLHADARSRAGLYARFRRCFRAMPSACRRRAAPIVELLCLLQRILPRPARRNAPDHVSAAIRRAQCCVRRLDSMLDGEATRSHMGAVTRPCKPAPA